MRNMLKNLIVNEDGATMVEYALMIALIGAALVTALGTLKTALDGKFTSVAGTISGAAPASQ